MSDAPEARLGLSVTHRRYVPHSRAHYGGSLVDGAYVLGLFGDVGTELDEPLVIVTAAATIVTP